MELLKNNWKWKLTSLIIGILMWSYITAGVNPTQSMTLSDIPITVQNQDDLTSNSEQITAMEFDRVSLKVTAKRNELSNLNRNTVTASIDASRLEEGSQSVSVHFVAPANVVINETSFDRMQVTVEKIVTGERKVVVQQEGTLPKLYVLNGLSVTPEYIEISGPRSLVDKVHHVEAKVRLDGLTEDTSSNVTVVPVDQHGNTVSGVTLSLGAVNISALIVKQKEVPIKLVFTGQSPEGLRVREATIAPKTVLVMGSAKDVDAVSSLSTVPLDRSQIVKDGAVPVKIVFPDGITPVNDEVTYNAQLTFETQEERTVNVPIERIKYQNAAGLAAQVTDEAKQIAVRIKGYGSDLDAVSVQNLELSVDLKDLQPGLQSVPVHVALPEGITFVSATPTQLLMNITKK